MVLLRPDAVNGAAMAPVAKPKTTRALKSIVLKIDKKCKSCKGS
jgi:hypothetical protein